MIKHSISGLLVVPVSALRPSHRSNQLLLFSPNLPPPSPIPTLLTRMRTIRLLT